MPRTVFQSAETPDIEYSAFDLSHEVRTSGIMGDLIPCFIQEIIPGDDFQVSTRHIIRLAPMLYPLFHQVDVYFHYFFVPNRIVWSSWEDFITGGEDGSEAPSIPKKDFQYLDTGGDVRLADYLGLPTSQSGFLTSDKKVSLLLFRAYQKIYNDYYRDQNLIDELDITDPNVVRDIRKRAWNKDYFTSSLPWTQRSENRVEIPVQVDWLDTPLSFYDGTVTIGDAIQTGGTGTGAIPLETPDGETMTRFENISALNMDIAELRRATALQRWLELSARTGSRYTEYLKANFNIRHSDQALQRPEYLGGGKSMLDISEVLATAEGTNYDPGYFAGHGISSGSAGFRKRFNEHGYVLGIMSVMPKTSYHQGIPRHFSRNDKFDFYHPLFAHIGEQRVLNQELYFDASDDEYNEGTFGYQQRFAEYKYRNSYSCGEFKDSSKLLPWTLDRVFTSQPTLSQTFIESDPDTRIFNIDDTSADHLWCYLKHNVQARRPIPYFSNPEL